MGTPALLFTKNQGLLLELKLLYNTKGGVCPLFGPARWSQIFLEPTEIHQ